MQTSLLLEMAADAFPARAAVGARASAVTLGRLAGQAEAAARLVAGRGERVGFLGVNGPAFPALLFGSALAGLPLVPFNYRLTDAELRRLLARTAPAVVVADDDMIGRIEGVEGIELVPRSRFEASCADAGPAPEPLPPVDPDVAILLFTSGTTGEPKAAVLRHRHLTSYVVSTVEFMGADEEEAALVSVPPYHIAGISAVLTGIYGGRRLVYLDNFTPTAWVDLAAGERISHAMVVPTMLARILDTLEARQEHLPHLRALSYGGGRMPTAVIERALRWLPHVDFCNAYGLTETSSTVALLGPEDHRACLGSGDHNVRARLASVGKPLPTVELQIRGPGGEVLPPGVSGEIYVRGDQVAGEYLHTSAIDRDGWFATNDAGHLDEAGYLFVEGRLDDVIVRGGENISPGEIEDVLRSHPAVADVAVLGLPCREWGEKVAAVVVGRDDVPCNADELGAWVRQRLRSTRSPETWDFRSELPYNETGKVLRRVLRQQLLQRASTS